MRKRTKSAKRILVEFQPKIEVVIDGYDVDDTYDIQNVVRIIDDCKMKLIDAGLEELQQDDNTITIYCDFSEFSNMQRCLENLNIEIQNSELQRIPNNTKKITAENAKLVLKLLDLLEENDDVQQVFHNMELTDEILKIMDSE